MYWANRDSAILLMVVIYSAPALWAGTIRDDTPDSSYTALAAQAAYAPVGAFSYTTSQGAEFATGTLISSRWVLTAGHVTSGSSNMTFQFAVPGTQLATIQLVTHPSFNVNDITNGFDIGLVKLSAPVTTVTPATRYTGNGEVGLVGTSVGFGYTGTGVTGFSSSNGITKRAGNNTIDLRGNVSPYFYSANVVLADFDNPAGTASTMGSTTALPLEYMIGPGDSGSGVFIPVGSSQQVAAVNAFGNNLNTGDFTGKYGDYMGSTRVAPFTDWIDDTIGNNWTGTSGSTFNFSDGTRWGDGAAPGANDIANFITSGTYTANLTGAVTNQRLRLKSSQSGSITNVTLNLAGNNYNLTMDRSVLVGNVSGDLALLKISGGGTLSGLEGIIGEAAGATGTVTVSGANSRWNTSGSVWVGGNSTGSGGTGNLNTDTSGAINVTGTLQVYAGGSVNLSGATSTVGTLAISGGAYSGTSNLTGTAFNLSSGTLGGSGVMTLSGLSTWTGGTINGGVAGGHVVANGGLTLNGSAGVILDNRTLDNGGTATWNGAGTITSQNGAVFNNLGSATFALQNNVNWILGTGSAVINNSGMFIKSIGTGTSIISPTLTNSGTVEADSGTLQFSAAAANSGSLVSGSGARITFAAALSENGGSFGGSGDISAAAGFNLTGSATKSGGGTLTIGGTQNNSAGSSLAVSGGTLALQSNAGSSSARNLSLSLSGSGTQGSSSSGQSLASLGIGAGSTFAILAGAGPLDANSLNVTLSGTAATSGAMDVANNSVIVRTSALSGATLQSTVQSYVADVKSGLNISAWNGPGIRSSTAAGNAQGTTALAIVQNNLSTRGAVGDGTTSSSTGTPLLTSLGGQTVGLNDTLIKYTYFGDANLDGKIDVSDYSAIDSAFLQGGTFGWINGDFNYDGKIDVSDYSLMDNAFLRQGAPLTSQVHALSGAGSLLPSLTVSSVPEPSSLLLALLGLAGLGLRHFWRRKSNR